jgi:hypothetical protein
LDILDKERLPLNPLVELSEIFEEPYGNIFLGDDE